MMIVAVAVGALIGLSLGALGGGGSILTVPALVYLMGMDTRAATTGSLIIVGITAVVGMVAHRRDGHVRVAQGIVFGLVGAAGAVLGTRWSLAVPPDVLLAGFSVLMLSVAALMLTRHRVPAHSGAPAADDQVPFDVPIISFRPRFVCACPRAARVFVAAVVVGLMTGFFGVGGGFLVVPALVLALDFPMPVAVGTSLLIIAMNSATSLLARAGSGIDVDWTVIGLFSGAAVLGSLLGARIATRATPGAAGHVRRPGHRCRPLHRGAQHPRSARLIGSSPRRPGRPRASARHGPVSARPPRPRSAPPRWSAVRSGCCAPCSATPPPRTRPDAPQAMRPAGSRRSRSG